MRIFLLVLLFLCAPSSVPAQPALESDSAPTAAAATTPSEAPAAPTVAPSLEAPPGSVPAPAAALSVSPVVLGPVEPEVFDGVPLKEAVDLYKETKKVLSGPTVFGIFTAVGALVALLVGLLRKFGNRLMTQKSVNKVGVILAAIAGGVGAVTPQMTWWQAAFMALSPLLVTIAPGDHPSTKG